MSLDQRKRLAIVYHVSYRLPDVCDGDPVLAAMDPFWCTHTLRFISWWFWKGVVVRLLGVLFGLVTWPSHFDDLLASNCATHFQKNSYRFFKW